MSDASFADTQTADFPLDFAHLQAAARRYEQQHAPSFWQLRQQAGADWQTLVTYLQAGSGSESELSALHNLLQDWPDAEALQRALLATPLPLLESCCQRLRAQLQPVDPDSLDPPSDSVPGLNRLMLNLLEAHCFGSVLTRAPAERLRALAALQSMPLAPLQVLASDLPVQASALASWLEHMPSERLKQLRDGCYTQLQRLAGSARQPFAELLICLNATLMLRPRD